MPASSTASSGTEVIESVGAIAKARPTASSTVIQPSPVHVGVTPDPNWVWPG